MHQDFDNEKQLDWTTLKKIEIIKDTLERMILVMNQPIDPKVIALLEMAIDMLEEQVHMDKVYEYPDLPDLLNEEPNKLMPSVDELKKMFDMDSFNDN
jgi:hypothetical protein